jgi:hypothetical protein
MEFDIVMTTVWKYLVCINLLFRAFLAEVQTKSGT